MTKKKWIGLILLLLLVGIQFIRIDKGSPEFDNTKDLIALENPPIKVENLLKEACYDCHSYESKYPWYTNVAPVSWWIKRHINIGRKSLNFSLWGTYSAKKKAHKIEENIEFVEEGWMPIGTYKLMHPKGRISDEERKLLTDWFKTLEH